MGMVPDANPATTESTNLEPSELYIVVRKAMEDAILNVIGTLLLVGLSLVLVWFGMVVATSSYNTSPVIALGGAFVVLVGIYQAASVLGIIPSMTDLI